jgi:hypothetical protein
MTTKETIDAILHFTEIIFAWPAIAAVILLIFRKPIIDFLSDIGKRLKKAEIGKTKLEFAEIKAVDTPIGKTNITALPTRIADRSPFEGFYATYRSSRYDFQISWPSSSWNATTEMPQNLHDLPPTVTIPLFIKRNEAIGDFYPNVNVVIESVDTITIIQYMTLAAHKMQQQGWIMLSTNVDEATQGGILIYLNTQTSKKLYQFARVIISAGNAYIVTASQLPPDDLLNQKMKEELTNILNSFRVVI